MDPRAAAKTAFTRHLEQNTYPGRGLVIGRAFDGDWLQVYWIMGRSPNSRNRRFVAEAGTLRTEPVDLAAVEDPSNIIYEAMLERPGLYLVSNGDQTRTLYDAFAAGAEPWRFEAALDGREREPDAPNYTPRISGLLDLRGAEPRLALSLLRANPTDPARTDRHSFRPAPPPAGLGLGLTTYAGDGDPLPSFSGEPLWLPLEGDPTAVLERYWGALDVDNRVALAVKRIPAAVRYPSQSIRRPSIRRPILSSASSVSSPVESLAGRFANRGLTSLPWAAEAVSVGHRSGNLARAGAGTGLEPWRRARPRVRPGAPEPGQVLLPTASSIPPATAMFSRTPQGRRRETHPREP